MILTNKEMKEIVDTYAKENNLDIEKYNLYDAINWYNWWQPQTMLWDRPASEYTYKEGKEEIINKVKRMINEYDWEEKYGYKGNYDGCKKFCKQCKYSCHKYNGQISYGCGSMFCTKMSDKYNVPIEVMEKSDICKYFKSIFEVDKDLNLEEYFDWLAYAWHVNFKGETTLPNKKSTIIINNIYLEISYLKYKDMNFIESRIIQCNKYYGGKWNVRSNKHKIQGKGNISVEEVLKLKVD